MLSSKIENTHWAEKMTTTRCGIRETATKRNFVLWLFLNNRNVLWHVKICHDAKVILWLSMEMTTMSSDFKKIPQTAKEMAYQLMDIFCMFSAPFMLQSGNGREFTNKIIQNLADMWPGMKLAHGKPRHSQSQGLVERYKLFETCWFLGCPTTTRKPGLKDYGLSKARKTKLCIQASRQALMGLCLERRRGLVLGILHSLETCTLQ